MALTAQHVERIIAFTATRIAAARKGHMGNDDTSQALRALDQLHAGLSAQARFVNPVPWPHPDLDPDGSLSRNHASLRKRMAEDAWDALRTIANRWQNHPDYHPDFILRADQFRNVPATAAKEN